MRENWVEIRLGKICSFKGGGTPSKKVPEYWNGTIPWASIKDLKGDYLKSTKDFITEKGLNESSSNLALENEIIIGTRINPGRPILTRITTAINQDLKIAKPKTKFDIKFLFYLFKNAERKILKVSSGTTVLGINLNSLNDIKITFPSRPEQRTIVSKIEQLFSELDNGIANLKSAKEKLEIYRHAVLKKAFEGNWTYVTIGDKFDFMGGGTPSKSNPDYWNGDIPWCSVKDVKGDLLSKTKDFITDIGVKESATNIAEIDQVILITRISPGKSIIAKMRTAINQDLKIVLPKFDYSSKFIHYLFKNLERECIKKSSGTTVLGINLKSLKEIIIPDIPIKDQDTIIEFIDSRISVCDKLTESINESLEKSEALRQSILKKAFSGELLTEKELEACKQEADWEPAEKLLERIKNK